VKDEWLANEKEFGEFLGQKKRYNNTRRHFHTKNKKMKSGKATHFFPQQTLTHC
jgi:hypothetical protein